MQEYHKSCFAAAKCDQCRGISDEQQPGRLQFRRHIATARGTVIDRVFSRNGGNPACAPVVTYHGIPTPIFQRLWPGDNAGKAGKPAFRLALDSMLLLVMKVYQV